MNHSPEPWFVANTTNGPFLFDAHVNEIVTGKKLDETSTYAVAIISEADAQRIVACINFCAGIPNSALRGDDAKVVSSTHWESI